MLDNAAVHLRDCTAALVGTDHSRARFEIASKLHPQSDQGGKWYWLLWPGATSYNCYKLFTLFALMLERENVVGVNVFE